MDKENQTVSFLKSITLNSRAWSIWWNLCPGLFLSSLLHSASAALSLYTAVWLSARMITEVAGSSSPRTVISLALAQVLSASSFSLLTAVLKRFKTYYADSASCLYHRIYMDKMFSLDYTRLDSQDTYSLYSQIIQNDAWSSLGIHETVSLFETFTAACAQILGGIILAAPLLSALVPPGSGSLSLLNHPLCGCFLIGLMLLIALFSSFCADKAQNYWTLYAPKTRLGNRMADFYISAAKDRKRALDMRIYNQSEIIAKLYMEGNTPFGPSSEIARCAKGPMGIWAALSQSVSAVLTVMIYLFVCLKAWAGAFGLGDVVVYTAAIANLFQGISQLSGALGRMAANGRFLETAFGFLDAPNIMYQGTLTTEKRSDGQYEIEFRNVSFCYPGAQDYALRHINMKFPIGSRLAIVGANGSGKTTFIKLLCRLYDPTEGEILLNGIDIRKYKYVDYIGLFSVVFQDFKLFALPLGENIAGSCRFDSLKASSCLEKAGFSNQKAVMPHGLSTFLYRDLDGRGAELSLGEAQKTAIARALYKDAPFMILDEPTAALDPVSEAEIYEKFGAITRGKTAVCISHRLSSCKFCDEVAVFDKGNLVQQGSHDLLLQDPQGKYYELWHAQAQYYYPENA